MGKRTIVDSIVGFIDGITPNSKDFWAPLGGPGTQKQKIHLTQVNNYYILENGKKKLVSQEYVNEEGEVMDIDFENR